MKRWIPLLLLCAMLSGCGNAEPTEPTDTADPSAVTEATTEATEPNLLVSSDGELNTYALDQDHCARIEPWGQDRYALFTTAGVLHLLSGEELTEVKSRDLECTLSPDDPSILVGDDKLGYYDSQRDAYITLGKNLTELSAITIRDDVTAGPLMNSDFTTLYYATADGIRALDISTGNSRLLRQEHQSITRLAGLDFDGTTLHYKRLLDNGVEQDCFIRTADGSLVETSTLNGELVTWGSHYAAVMEFQLPLTRYREIITGTLESTPQRLSALGDQESILFAGNGTVLLQDETESDLILELYDLEAGERIAQYSNAAWTQAFSSARYDGTNLWLWHSDSPELLRLDISQHTPAPTELAPFYTLSNPAPLDDARAIAQTIADSYGVGFELSSTENRTTGVNYDAWPDYRPQEYAAALTALKQAMDAFPEGFFQRLKLTIRLTDDFDPAQGLPEGTGDLVIGERRIMDLSICDNMLEIFYHELFHAMELYITSETNKMSNWDDQNPEGFSYAGSTIPYESGELAQSEFLYAVADDYGLVSAREDRAQIFLYAMMEGQEALFESEVVQAKLSTICTAIRYAWGWRKVQTQFPWEQYLAAE